MHNHNFGQQLPHQVWMKAADVANQSQPRGKQRVFIFFISIFFYFVSFIFIREEVQQWKAKIERRSFAYIFNFHIFAAAKIRIFMPEKQCCTVTTIVLDCRVVFFVFSNLIWFTMPPLMIDSFDIAFVRLFVFRIFTRHVSKGLKSLAANFRITYSSCKLMIICHNINTSLHSFRFHYKSLICTSEHPTAKFLLFSSNTLVKVIMWPNNSNM